MNKLEKLGKILTDDFERNLIKHIMNPKSMEEFKDKLRREGGAWCNRVLKEIE